jgi:hypothetical protein
VPSAQLLGLRSGLRFLQHPDDLLFRIPRRLHGLLLVKQTLLPSGTKLGCQVVPYLVSNNASYSTMTHIADLTPVSYMGLDGPIRAVGWLESPHPFRRGPVDPGFIRRLMALVERPLFGTMMAGIQHCSLCHAENRIGPDCRSSQAELFIPASDCVYEAPVWIGHYVLAHGYVPPEEFMRAVMACPEPASLEFREAVHAHVPGFSGDDRFKVGTPDAQWTLKPSSKYGNKAAYDVRTEKCRRNTAPLPTREQLIEKHGGISHTKCTWAKCDNLALADMVVCFEHAYPATLP